MGVAHVIYFVALGAVIVADATSVRRGARRAEYLRRSRAVGRRWEFYGALLAFLVCSQLLFDEVWFAGAAAGVVTLSLVVLVVRRFRRA